MKTAQLFLSPLVQVEPEPFREIGRVRGPVEQVLAILRDDHGVRDAAGEVSALARAARVLHWTRDPFDRLIVAHAVARNAKLLTADQTILEHCSIAHWD